MEGIRLNAKNKILNEIRQLNSFIKTCTSTIGRLKNMNSEDKYVIVQMKKNETSLQTYTSEIESLNKKLKDLSDGLLDEELQDNIKQETLKASVKGKQTLKEKAEKKKVSEEDEKKSKDFYEMTRKSDKQDKKYFYKSAAAHFFRTNPPEWMSNELQNMPCNEGYIYKNIYFYGEKPKKGDTYTLYENFRGYKHIHVWNKTHEYIYKQLNRQEKTLIQSKLRKTRQ